MDTLNLHEEEQSVFDNFIHRNTRTEISNFEGSFRPCLFSRIESNSSFDSSFENSAEDFTEIINEQRPLSKSYKPDSVLKTSFLTDRPSSPSFKEFDARNTGKDLLGTFKEVGLHSGMGGPPSLPGLGNFSSGAPAAQLPGNASLPGNGGLSASAERRRNRRGSFDKAFKAEEFSSDVVKLAEGKNHVFKSASNEFDKDLNDDKFLTLIDIISQKDDEIKDLRTQVIDREREISENCSKIRTLQAKLLKLGEENTGLQQVMDALNDKYLKAEAFAQKLQGNLGELQKEMQKIGEKREDRVRKTDELARPDKLEGRLKELAGENEQLKQELQKRPTPAQYQSSIARIEELEGMLSNRKKSHRPEKLEGEKNDRGEAAIVAVLLETLRLASPAEIVPAVKSLRSPNTNSKLVKRISNLIQDCVPPGTFKDGPCHRDIWKFIRNVMEAYIQLKKNEDHIMIGKIQGCLGIGENSNAYQEVLKIYNSLHFMELVFDKLKSKLGLSPHATTEDVEKAVDEL